MIIIIVSMKGRLIQYLVSIFTFTIFTRLKVLFLFSGYLIIVEMSIKISEEVIRRI